MDEPVAMAEADLAFNSSILQPTWIDKLWPKAVTRSAEVTQSAIGDQYRDMIDDCAKTAKRAQRSLNLWTTLHYLLGIPGAALAVLGGGAAVAINSEAPVLAEASSILNPISAGVAAVIGGVLGAIATAVNTPARRKDATLKFARWTSLKDDTRATMARYNKDGVWEESALSALQALYIRKAKLLEMDLGME